MCFAKDIIFWQLFSDSICCRLFIVAKEANCLATVRSATLQRWLEPSSFIQRRWRSCTLLEFDWLRNLWNATTNWSAIIGLVLARVHYCSRNLILFACVREFCVHLVALQRVSAIHFRINVRANNTVNCKKYMKSRETCFPLREATEFHCVE